MKARFLRPDGLIRATLTPQGDPLDDSVILYDQAFCLFALAAAAGIGLDAEAQTAAAERLHDRLLADWRCPAGGFVERDAHPYQANAHMHLFEASLAWEAVLAGDPRAKRWTDQANAIGELALSQFIDPVTGALREFFDDHWQPAAGADGRLVEPGHLFEWAWLLMRWAKLRGREDAALAARRMHRLGVDHGIDPARGVAIDAISTDLTVVSDRARLWPQTERIKASAILGQHASSDTERASYAAEVAAAAKGLWLYLQTPMRGLWRDKLLADGTFVDEPAPASSLYHIACAILDARARGFPV
jgi:mannose-6-phosphate isomerase